MKGATHESRHALAVALLRKHPDWTDRRICAHYRVCRDLVRRNRAELIRSGELPARGPRLCRDGKIYFGVEPINQSLIHRVATIQKITRDIGDDVWKKADDRTRRAFWIAAERLADRVGILIDRSTGECLAPGPVPR